jgi:hypothetical protein
MTDTIRATDVLLEAAEMIHARASQRDHATGERSIPRAVAMYNVLTGQSVSERDGWILQALLKLSRAQGGRHHLDDYVDAAAYIALAAETAEAQQPPTLQRTIDEIVKRPIVPKDDRRGLDVAGSYPCE